jgi:hypothetical protein
MNIKLVIFTILLPLVSVSQYNLKPIGDKIQKMIVKPPTGSFFIEAPVKVIYKMSKDNKTTIKITGYQNLLKFLSIKSKKEGSIIIKWQSKVNIDKANYPTINIFSPRINNFVLSHGAFVYTLSPLKTKKLIANVNEASTLKIPDIFAQQISLSVSGASNVSIINLRNTNLLKINLTGASDINIEGNHISKAVINVSEASDLKMEGIKTDYIKINVSNTSDAYIRPINEVYTTATNESEIIIFGNPKKITKMASGLSKIILRK